MSANGFLNVNKPEGRTSFSIITWLRNISGEKRIGHTGTLDPMAAGVLPICIGQATKITRFVIDHDKAYLAQIELGIATDTFDGTGKIVFCGDSGGITLDRIEEALSTFRGTMEQSPPVYSAIKYKGKHLYQLARSGVKVTPKPREVTIISCEIVDYVPPLLTVRLECSKGTYIRSIANDLGRILGCGAHLKKLVRNRCGIFKIGDSSSVEQIERAFNSGTWQNLLYPVDAGLYNFKKVFLTEEESKLISNGGFIDLNGTVRIDDRVCAYDNEKRLLAILTFHKVHQRWHAGIGFRL